MFPEYLLCACNTPQAGSPSISTDSTYLSRHPARSEQGPEALSLPFGKGYAQHRRAGNSRKYKQLGRPHSLPGEATSLLSLFPTLWSVPHKWPLSHTPSYHLPFLLQPHPLKYEFGGISCLNAPLEQSSQA